MTVVRWRGQALAVRLAWALACTLACGLVLVLAGTIWPVAARAGAATAAATVGLEPAAGPDPSLPVPATQLAETQLQALDTRALEALLAELNREWDGYAPEVSLRDVLTLHADGGSPWRPEVIVRGLGHYLFREVVANADLLAKLVVLAVLAAVLQNLGTALGREATGRLAQTVVYLVMAALALGGFALAVDTAGAAMQAMSDFVLALLPVLTALMVSLGNVTRAALLNPVLVVGTSWVGALMATVVFPLVFLSAVLDIVSGVSDHLRLSNLAALLRQGAITVLGLTLTVFMGLTYVKAAAGGVADSVTLRTARFMAGAFIPVVGKLFADATELVWSSGHLLKSALGVVGMLAVFLIAAFPAVKILSLAVVYRLAAALVQPVGQTLVAQSLNTMSGALILVFCAVATMALMFFIGITILVGASMPGVAG